MDLQKNPKRLGKTKNPQKRNKWRHNPKTCHTRNREEPSMTLPYKGAEEASYAWWLDTLRSLPPVKSPQRQIHKMLPPNSNCIYGPKQYAYKCMHSNKDYAYLFCDLTPKIGKKAPEDVSQNNTGSEPKPNQNKENKALYCILDKLTNPHTSGIQFSTSLYSTQLYIYIYTMHIYIYDLFWK